MPSLRLLCWNVHAVPLGYSRHRTQRLGAIAQVVRELAPDVAVLQEVWLPADADYLERALDGAPSQHLDAARHATSDPPRPGYHAARDTGHVLGIDPAIPFAGLMTLPYSLARPWRRSGLFTLVREDGPWRFESETFAEFENEASDWAFWEQDGKNDKGLQHVRLRHASGQRLDVVNTHLQAEYTRPLAYADVRKAQVAELTAFVARASGDVPVVCAGDLNTAAPTQDDDFDRDAYEHLTRTHGWRDLTARFRDACLAADPRPFWRCQTYVHASGRGDWIDYVLTRAADRVEIESLRVLANVGEDDPWSDHHGLFAELDVCDTETCGLPLALAAVGASRPLRRRDLLGLAGLAAVDLLSPG